jgi:DNA repair protein RecO
VKAIIKDSGYLYRTIPFGDSSLILQTFMRGHGFTSLIAKGIRKKPELAQFINLNQYEFTFYDAQENELHLLKELSPLKEQTLYNKPESWAAADCALELYRQMIIPLNETGQYYGLFVSLTGYLENCDKNAILIWWRFLLKVFQLLGIPYNTEQCSFCEKLSLDMTLWITGTGGLVCSDCGESHFGSPGLEPLAPLSSRILGLLPQIGNHIQTLRPDAASVEQLNNLFDAYYTSHFNTQLKLQSRDVLIQFYP